MIAWIFDSEEYTARYYELLSEFLGSVDFGTIVSETAEMIDKYVEKDPTIFCTYDEFKKGVVAIKGFCELRAESIKGQLDGSIPSTSEGQSADSSALIDCSSLTLSDMGTMGGGMGGGFGGFGGKGGRPGSSGGTSTRAVNLNSKQSNGGKPNFGGNMPENFDPSQFGGEMPQFDGENMPEGFDPSQFGVEMPEGFDPSKFGGERPGSSAQKSSDSTGEGADNDNSEKSKSDRPEKPDSA